MFHLQREVDQAKETLAKLQTERKALSHRDELLRPTAIDPDLLDEEARKSLNYSKPNEIIVLTPNRDTAVPNH